MGKRITLRNALFIILAGVLLFAVHECYSPRMSPEKFVRNTYVTSIEPPKVHHPRHTAIVARVSNRYDFYQRQEGEGKKRIGVDLADFRFRSTTHEGAFLPRSYFMGKKVRVRRFVINAEIVITQEDLAAVQKVLLEKPFDQKALEKAPLTDTQKALLRFWFFGISKDNVQMVLLIKAKPVNAEVVFVNSNKDLVDILISTEIISVKTLFEPAEKSP